MHHVEDEYIPDTLTHTHTHTHLKSLASILFGVKECIEAAVERSFLRVKVDCPHLFHGQSVDINGGW